MDFDIVDELRELRLERPASILKSPEELEKLTVDEHLNGVERAVYLLSSGQEIQKISVVSQLYHLLRDNRDECMRRVVPKVRELLPVAQVELQKEASIIFQQLLRDSIVPSSVFGQTFLPTVLSFLDSKDFDIAELWLSTLLEIMTLLPAEVVSKEVLPKALSKGQISQPVPSRLISCQMLGKMGLCLSSATLHKDVLVLVQSLCQDVEYEVRACMCRQLHLLAEGLGAEDVKRTLLPELVELAADEESSVRLAGLDTVVSMVPLLDSEACAATVAPLAIKSCQVAMQQDDEMLPFMAKLLGKLVHGLQLQDCLTATQKDWFLDYYKKLCSVGLPETSPSMLLKSGGAYDNAHRSAKQRLMASTMSYSDDERLLECRTNSAYNFPAMVDFAGGGTTFEAKLYETFSKLCRDPSSAVRRIMAASCHELVKSAGIPFNVIAKDFMCLLKDDSIEVLRGLISNLSTALEAFAAFMASGSSRLVENQASAVNVPVPASMPSSSDLMTAVLACDAVVSASYDWRLQEELVLKMAALTKCCSNDHVYSRLIPSLMHRLHNTVRALPVRRVTARTLLTVLRNVKRLEQREKVYTQITQDFCKGKSFRHRTTFIDVCGLALDMYSHRFFKEHWFETSLELAGDSVADVRLRLCTLLPRLKRLVRLPADRSLLQQLEACVRRLLINERDKVVLATLKVTVENLDRTQCIIDSVISNSRSSKWSPADEKELAEDRRRDDEERALVDMEEKETKEEEEKSKSDKKSLGGTKSRPNIDKDKNKKAGAVNKIEPRGKTVAGTMPANGGLISGNAAVAAAAVNGTTGDSTKDTKRVTPGGINATNNAANSANVVATSSVAVSRGAAAAPASAGRSGGRTTVVTANSSSSSMASGALLIARPPGGPTGCSGSAPTVAADNATATASASSGASSAVRNGRANLSANNSSKAPVRTNSNKKEY